MSGTKRDKVRPSRLNVRDIVAVSCFFVSGFVGLVYEICWIRKASLVFGATTFALSTVLAVFFAGLAIGSYVFGRYSRWTFRPLRVYGVLEIVLGVTVFFNPEFFSCADYFYGLFYPSIMSSFALLSFVRFALIVLVVVFPAILMGATLPLFCRQYVVRREKISLPVGLLYGLNTLGAAIGCVVCGFYLIPKVGVNTAIRTGAVLNILIGLVVSRIGLRAVSRHEPASKAKGDQGKGIAYSMPSAASSESGGMAVGVVSVLFFFSGFVALGSEILWTRYLSLIIHNTVYTYTLTLAVVLFGIVAGSILICGFADRMRRRALVFGIIHVLTGIIVLMLLMLPARWWRSVTDTQRLSSQLWVFVSVLLVPAILSGMSFPLAIRMVVERPWLAGVGVGKMSAINTVGGIAGSLAVGFFILPQLGLQRTLFVTTGLSLLMGLAAWILLERTVTFAAKGILVAFSSLLWLSIPFITDTRLPADFLAAREKLVDFREGISSNLAVVRQGEIVELRIDRLWQGWSRKNHQIMAAHIPALLHKGPKDICVIGVGVGQTAKSFLLHDVGRLDCVDIEAELFGFVRKHFESAWMDDERVRFIVEDGRNYLAHTNCKYDIISIEVGQTFRPGLASFYSCDFYRRARGRLNNNGIITQFAPILHLGADEFRSVIRSFTEVFPQSVLWYNTSELLLIGIAAEGVELSGERLAVLSNENAISDDLRFAYWGGLSHRLNRPEAFLAGFLCGAEGLGRLAAQAPSYRDDLPVLEYSTARKQSRNPEAVVKLIESCVEPVSVVFGEQLSDKALSEIQSIRQQNLYNIMADYLSGTSAVLYRPEVGIVRLREGLKWNPANIRINMGLGQVLLEQGRTEQARIYYGNVLRVDPENAEAQNNMGYTFLEQGRLDEARRHFSEAVRLEPEFAEAHYNLGNVLARQSRAEAAKKHLGEALRFNPKLAEAHNIIGVLLLQEGKVDAAIERFTKALRLKPGLASARKNLNAAFSRRRDL